MVHALTHSQTERRMVITDLDGTLLNSDRLFSPANLSILDELGQQQILRVIATGRSLYSAHKVIPAEFPIDYLVFSSGAGILDWQTQTLLLAHHLSAHEISHISQTFIGQHIDFMLHRSIPDNHYFWYHSDGKQNPDFVRRCELYQSFASPLEDSVFPVERACQFVAVVPGEDSPIRYQIVKTQLSGVQVIRTTSPLDGESTWIEVFPKTVSKALASEWLAHKHQIPQSATLALGNDYNDLDLLRWAGRSCVVDNAPSDLKQIYHVVASNNADGFSDAVKFWINH